MKRLIGYLTGAVLVAGLILAGCQVPTASGGTLRVVLPAKSSARDISSSTAIRLQLTRNGAIVSLSGGNYIEKSLGGAGQTVSVDGLSPGSGYVLLVSTGHYAGTGNFYNTDDFSKSDAFEISAGVNTAVSVTLQTGRVAVLEGDNGPHGATVLGSALYYLDGSNIYSTTNPTSPGSSYASLGGASGVQSLSSDGSSELWLNTTAGIATNANGSFAVSMFDDHGSSITPSVTDSGKAALGSNSFSYYYGSGLTAGLETSNDSDWWTTDDLFNFSADIRSKLQGQMIRGVAYTSQFAAVATSIGAFRVESSMLTSASDLGTDFTNGTYNSSSILLQPSDPTLLIGPVSAILSGSTAMIFGGTAKGLYAANVNSTTGAPVSDGQTLSLVSGTQGLNITKLATYGSVVNDGTVTGAYTVAYSAGTREVLVIRNQTVIDRISAFEGLPSGDLRLTLYATSSNLYLVATGSDATVYVPLAVLQAAP